jgi:cbb3-type cytochrome c oxidase subunit III
MKRTATILVSAFAVLLLASTISSAQAGQPGTITPDSARKYCKEVFANNCSGCHGEKGQGTVGPNLTDKYWIHGGSQKNVGSTIKEGVAGKGMISWNAVFTDQEIQRLAECVLMMQGTDPAKAKKPEGEPYEGRKN